jgi:hypothetical protein
MTRTGVYRGLLRLYPRDFRLEYGEDMSQLLALQLRDENAARVWGRTVLDLALTVPSLRLESLMSRRSTLPAAFFVYAAAAVASLVITALSGTAFGLGTAGLLLGVAFASLAVLAWRRAHALRAGSPVSLNWWRYVGAGVAGIAACVLVARLVDDDLPGHTWFVWMIVLLTSMVVTAVGVFLGLMYAFATRRTASS